MRPAPAVGDGDTREPIPGGEAGFPARLDSLTGLRFVAALMVFIRHADSEQWGVTLGPIDRLAAGGAQGVSFFFLLSGFVLVWSRRSTDSAGSFYRRRAARILPAYYAVWPVALLVAYWEDFVPSLTALAANLTLMHAWVPQMSVYFGLNSVTWSLSVELLFYLVFPLLIPALLRLGSVGRWALMAGLVAGVTAFNVAGAGATDYTGDGYYRVDVGTWLQLACPVARLPEFVIGALLAAELRAGRRFGVGVPVALSLALVAVLAIGLVGNPLTGQWPTLIPFALLLVACAARDMSGRPTAFAGRAMVRLGEWSFAFYLVHQLVIRVIHRAGFVPGGTLESVAFVALALVLSVAASAALYSYVERPAERRLRGSRRPRAQVEALAGPARP